MDKWVAGQTLAPIVDLSKIDRTPVTFVLPIKEINCPNEVHEAAFYEITAPNSFIRFEKGGHLMVWLEADEA